MSMFDQKEYSRLWYLKNRDRIRAKTKSRYHSAREAHLSYHRNYRQTHAEEIAIKQRAWYSKNVDRVKKWAQENRQKIRESSRKWKKKVRLEMIESYGGQCSCCGEKSEEFLTLEHLNGGGNEHRRRIGTSGVMSELRRKGWPKDGYTILCMNCNWATRFKKICPHKIKL